MSVQFSYIALYAPFDVAQLFVRFTGCRQIGIVKFGLTTYRAVMYTVMRRMEIRSDRRSINSISNDSCDHLYPITLHLQWRGTPVRWCAAYLLQSDTSLFSQRVFGSIL